MDDLKSHFQTLLYGAFDINTAYDPHLALMPSILHFSGMYCSLFFEACYVILKKRRVHSVPNKVYRLNTRWVESVSNGMNRTTIGFLWVGLGHVCYRNSTHWLDFDLVLVMPSSTDLAPYEFHQLSICTVFCVDMYG